MIIKKKLMINKIWCPNELYYKKGAISCLKSIEFEDILLLTTKPVRESEYFSKVEKFLDGKSVSIEIIERPSEKEIFELKNKHIEKKPQAIIAIGGGSVIDSAKLLHIILSFPELSIEDIKNNPFLNEKNTYLIAVPTTPSTGSEASPVSVIYSNDGTKNPIVNHGFIPDLTILDQNFLKTLTIENIYRFGSDIFAHAVESYLSLASTPLLKAMAKSGLDLLCSGFSKLKENPTDINALGDILYAGYLAGVTQGNAFVGIAHALAHSLEKQLILSHSDAILLLIKDCLIWINNNKPKKQIDDFIAIYEKIGFEKYLDKKILKNIDIEKWSEDALNDPSISTTPIRMKKDQVIEVIEWILKN